MSTLLIAFHLFICVVLVLVVLVQAGKDGGMGMMAGGSSQTIFGSSGGANFFTKFTSVTAALFMITSITLTLMKAGKKRSIFDTMTTPISAPAQNAAPAAAAPVASDAKTAPAAPAQTPAHTK